MTTRTTATSAKGTITMAGITTTCFLLLVLSVAAAGGNRRKPAYTEEQRQLEYIKRGHTFPFNDYTPNTTGWRRLMDRR
jgi:hypothetical protein